MKVRDCIKKVIQPSDETKPANKTGCLLTASFWVSWPKHPLTVFVSVAFAQQRNGPGG
jgi:hypothetical protein